MAAGILALGYTFSPYILPDNVQKVGNIPDTFTCVADENTVPGWQVTSTTANATVVLVTTSNLPNTVIVAHLQNGATLAVGDYVTLSYTTCAEGLTRNQSATFHIATLKE